MEKFTESKLPHGELHYAVIHQCLLTLRSCCVLLVVTCQLCLSNMVEFVTDNCKLDSLARDYLRCILIAEMPMLSLVFHIATNFFATVPRGLNSQSGLNQYTYLFHSNQSIATGMELLHRYHAFLCDSHFSNSCEFFESINSVQY